jgi:hypothetical protein
VRSRKTQVLLLGVLLLGGASVLATRSADGQTFNCFQTVIGCGEAWIKTCTCPPPP